MPKIVKVYSPDELERQVHFIVREHQSPGLLKFLAALPFGTEGAWWRGVGMLWIQQHAESPEFQQELAEVLAATGVEAGAPPPRKRRASVTLDRKAPAAGTRRTQKPSPPVAQPPVVTAQSPTPQVLAAPAVDHVTATEPDELTDRSIELLDLFGSMAD